MRYKTFLCTEKRKMYRSALEKLKTWQQKSCRNPLIIRGARQVGKTWLMREFGRLFFKKIAYINFDHNERMKQLFAGDRDVQRLIDGISIETKTNITSNDTLIIFDEIQECPDALSSLKYFCEDQPDLAIISAGSLLGVALKHEKISFPVGKVEFLDIYPLSFDEFLQAIGEEQLLKQINDVDFEMIRIFKPSLIKFLKSYFYVGGMPEAVASYIESHDMDAVRNIQKSLLQAYLSDFSKHISATSIPKLNIVWQSIPSQLAKENKKFIYRELKHGARAKEFEYAIEWLKSCGLVHSVYRISKPDIPITAYHDSGAFKLFIVDIGLLCAMADVDPRTLLDGNKIFEEFKGALAEQFVLQQLKTLNGVSTSYWASNTSEIDFIVQYAGNVIPVEVKAAINLQAKSLKVYNEKYHPKFAIRTSLADYRSTNNLFDIPLFMIDKFPKMLNL